MANGEQPGNTLLVPRRRAELNGHDTDFIEYFIVGPLLVLTFVLKPLAEPTNQLDGSN
jgi:hypothetical protein